MDKTSNLSLPKRLFSLVLNFVRGGLIGIAEIIPGVSGGTIALITGVYDRVINSASSAVRGLLLLFGFSKSNFTKAKSNFQSMSWSLLIPMLIGMFVALFVAASIVEPLIDNYPSIAKALFAGMIMISLIVPIRLSGSKWNFPELLVSGLAAAVAFALASIPKAVDAQPSFLIIAASAALAVCALVLPGVSGSYLLLAIGMYAPTIAAVNDRDFGYLGTFVLGAIIGLGAFVGVLQWLLEHKRRLTLIVMTGLMAGSLRALWPWQAESGQVLVPTNFSLEFLAFAVGGVVVFALITIEKVVSKKTSS